MISIATPISSLMKSINDSLIISDFSDCWECRDDSIDCKFEKQEVFHCELQPIHKLNADQFNYLEKIKNSKPDLKLITFHCASNCDRPLINKDGIFEIGGVKYSRSEMLINAKKNFLIIKKIFGSNIRIGIENNNYYNSAAYEDITEPEFISDIVYSNDIEFLFDIAHAKVTCHNKNIDFIAYKEKLPLDRVIQLHICRYGINKNGLAYDAHELPGLEEINEVKYLINKFDIKYLTVEFYKDKNKLINFLKELKQII